ncbi:MAG: pyridoxamine 5'-phosphate oxidase family protein [Beutenbergiaceae bacterium]
MAETGWSSDDERSPASSISAAQCWQFLSEHEFGRLAFHLVGEVHITPLNYYLDGHRLVFRTAEGSKFLAVHMNDDVAFEVDQIDGTRATSVVLRGKAHTLEGEAARLAEQLPLRPWIGTSKHNIVEIAVSEIHGRRFRLAEPHTA